VYPLKTGNVSRLARVRLAGSGIGNVDEVMTRCDSRFWVFGNAADSAIRGASCDVVGILEGLDYTASQVR